MHFVTIQIQFTTLLLERFAKSESLRNLYEILRAVRSGVKTNGHSTAFKPGMRHWRRGGPASPAVPAD